MARILAAVVVLIVIIVIVGVIFRGRSPVQPLGEVVSQEGQSQTVSIKDIADAPVVFMDETFTLEGTISKWISKRAFNMTDKGFSGRSILVVNQNNFPNPETVETSVLALGDKVPVKVRGTIRVYTQDQKTNFGPELIGNQFPLSERQAYMLAEKAEEIQ